jgi:hypothetical protein
LRTEWILAESNAREMGSHWLLTLEIHSYGYFLESGWKMLTLSPEIVWFFQKHQRNFKTPPAKSHNSLRFDREHLDDCAEQHFVGENIEGSSMHIFGEWPIAETPLRLGEFCVAITWFRVSLDSISEFTRKGIAVPHFLASNKSPVRPFLGSSCFIESYVTCPMSGGCLFRTWWVPEGAIVGRWR